MFGLIINPPDRTAVARYCKPAGYLPLPVSEKLFLQRMQPEVLGLVRGLKSQHTGNRIDGNIVGVGITPRMIRAAYAKNNLDPVAQRVIAGVRLTIENGARHVAITGQVGGGKLADQVIKACEEEFGDAIRFTCGNGLTTAAAIHVVREEMDAIGLAPEDATIAIIGVYGSLGAGISKLIAQGYKLGGRQFKRCLLFGNNEAETTRAVRERRREGMNAEAATDRMQLRQADVVIVCTNNSHPFLKPKHFKENAIVCDLAVPYSVHSSVIHRRSKDVRVILGGAVRAPSVQPSGVTYGFNIGHKPGECYACMAEIELAALEPQVHHALTTRSLIDVQHVKTLDRYAELHGFRYIPRRREEQLHPLLAPIPELALR